MLVCSAQCRAEISRKLSQTLRAKRVIRQIILREGSVAIKTVEWGIHWKPFLDLFSDDTRILHRVNRLKRAWEIVLSRPRSRRAQAYYCWRYFGLLHYAVRVAREQRGCEAVPPTIRHILGFEAFWLNTAGAPNSVAGVVCQRNPVYMLGRLPKAVPHPSPRHIPMALPVGADLPFYHYRQYTLDRGKTKVLLFPSSDLSLRQESFRCIDHFSRITANRPDPYVDKRARVLADRVLAGLLNEMIRRDRLFHGSKCCRLLDLGGGTGHLLGKVWSNLWARVPRLAHCCAEIHTIEATKPSLGRTYGISGQAQRIQNIQWTIGDYRSILDDQNWGDAHGPFHIAIIARLLDNCSLFNIETASGQLLDRHKPSTDCLPHRTLSPSRFPSGIDDLYVKTQAERASGSRVMPQFSLHEYFRAMRELCYGRLTTVADEAWLLPVRRFNPGALVTRNGQSVIGQLTKICQVIVIEDLDLDPPHLVSHMKHFHLHDRRVIQFINDSFSTEVFHYAIVHPTLADTLKGKRIW